MKSKKVKYRVQYYFDNIGAPTSDKDFIFLPNKTFSYWENITKSIKTKTLKKIKENQCPRWNFKLEEKEEVEKEKKNMSKKN